MKYIGAIMIIASCGLIGFIAAGKTIRRVSSLNSTLTFLKLYMVELGCSMSSTDELIRHTVAVSNAPVFAEKYLMLRGSEKDLPIAWNDAVWECREQLCLEKKDASLIAGLGNIFGCYDVQGQLKAINACIDQLELLIKQADKRCEQKAPVYRTLGVLAGVAAAIVIC